MFLINGREQDSLAASDRATQFGDGCFTTARIRDGRICLLPAHLRRLQDACEKLLLPFSQWTELQHEMTAMAAGQNSGVLKVILSRGSGGRATARQTVVRPREFYPFLLIPLIMNAGVRKVLRWR